MGILDNLKDQLAASRLEEERYYQAALAEIENGERRPGLWAKALANSSGDEAAAKSEYLKLLVQRLKDEAHIEKRTRERQRRELQIKEEQRRRNEKARQERKAAEKQAVLQRTQSPPEDDNSTFILLLWIGGIIGFIFLIVYFGSANGDPAAPQTQPESTSVTSSPIPTPTNERDSDHEPDDYDEMVTYLESRYPELNPNHRHFSAATTSTAVDIRDEYLEMGYTDVDALLLAVHDIFGDLLTEEEPIDSAHHRSEPERTPETQATPNPYPNCEFKAVMTDQDYRNCGIEPPSFD